MMNVVLLNAVYIWSHAPVSCTSCCFESVES